MDIITLEEVLWHYTSRLNLAIENIEKQRKDIQELMMLFNESYKSEHSDRILEKFDECEKDTKRVQTHFEDAMYFIKKQINELEEIIL